MKSCQEKQENEYFTVTSTTASGASSQGGPLQKTKTWMSSVAQLSLFRQ